MKKIAAITAFIALFQGLTFAQTISGRDIRLGFQVSPMFSTMNTSDNKINGNGANLGMKLGMLSEMYFRENYAFLVGIGFAFNTGGTSTASKPSAGWIGSTLADRCSGAAVLA